MFLNSWKNKETLDETKYITNSTSYKSSANSRHSGTISSSKCSQVNTLHGAHQLLWSLLALLYVIITCIEVIFRTKNSLCRPRALFINKHRKYLEQCCPVHVCKCVIVGYPHATSSSSFAITIASLTVRYVDRLWVKLATSWYFMVILREGTFWIPPVRQLLAYKLEDA